MILNPRITAKGIQPIRESGIMKNRVIHSLTRAAGGIKSRRVGSLREIPSSEPKKVVQFDICNVLKLRTPGNRDPMADEIEEELSVLKKILCWMKQAPPGWYRTRLLTPQTNGLYSTEDLRR